MWSRVPTTSACARATFSPSRSPARNSPRTRRTPSWSTWTGTDTARRPAARELMLRDLANREEVVRASERLLRLSEVRDRLPTPIDDLIAAAGLHRGEDDLFASATIDQAPAHLRKAVRALRGKLHAVLDRRRRKVYINPEITHDGRRAFRALHEVGHDILPSQNDPAHADDQFTLSWQTRMRWERDANQTAAELLFQRERFTRM